MKDEADIIGIDRHEVGTNLPVAAGEKVPVQHVSLEGN